jgi:hypothetical protein
VAERRHIHLDAVGGIAGDMFVAAVLDALPELRERVLADAASALPSSLGTPGLEPGSSCGLAVLRFGLTGAEAADATHSHAGPSLFPEMVAHIEKAHLHHGTAEQAVAILRILAEAEGRIHGVPIDDVHFHELSDWDSLMDVVAAGSIAAALAGAVWSISDLPRGGGLVQTQHGKLPVPAPATALILEGFIWRDDGVKGERVTPTGAAILRHLVNGTRNPAAARLSATGMGAGTRELPELPNILRALVFDSVPGKNGDIVAVMSFDLDDMSGEEIATAMDHLRRADGVLDVTIGQRIGKKGRPVQDVRVLLQPGAMAAVQQLCFTETSTIGLRWRFEERAVLERELDVKTIDGRSVGVKRVKRPTGGASAKAESDDVAELHGLARRRHIRARAEQEGET